MYESSRPDDEQPLSAGVIWLPSEQQIQFRLPVWRQELPVLDLWQPWSYSPYCGWVVCYDVRKGREVSRLARGRAAATNRFGH